MWNKLCRKEVETEKHVLKNYRQKREGSVAEVINEEGLGQKAVKATKEIRRRNAAEEDKRMLIKLKIMGQYRKLKTLNIE